MKKKLRGYVSSRKFFEYNPPQKIQNLALRDYCKTNNYNYLLSATEYSMKDSYLILNEHIEFEDKSDGLVFYSLFQLPTAKIDRDTILRKVLYKKKSIHFVLESIVFHKIKDLEKINNLFYIKQSYEKCMTISEYKLNIFTNLN